MFFHPESPSDIDILFSIFQTVENFNIFDTLGRVN